MNGEQKVECKVLKSKFKKVHMNKRKMNEDLKRGINENLKENKKLFWREAKS